MSKMLLVAGLCVSAVGCGGGMTKEQAKQQLDQLVVLYSENKTKFVAQKQEMIQADSCERVSAIKQAMDEKAAAAAMSPGDTQMITQLKMEFDQAERDCLAK